jgi:peptidoglycan/xylan/chitin deacetylase (PgdA/CDA1 family)
MATLRAHGAPATFFINGRRVDSDATQQIVEDIVRDPLFELANHTWSHPNMKQQSSGEVARQIDDTTSVIETAGGEARYFRFPFGASTCSTAQAARDRGYAVTGWHVDSADWCFATGSVGLCPESQFRFVDDDVRDDMMAYTMRQVRAKQGGVVLFHDIHSYTANQLDRFLGLLEDEGYTVVPLDDDGVFPRLNDAPAAPPPAPPVTPIGDDSTQARVTTDLWLRAAPSASATGITVMPAGSIVTLTGNSEGDWLELHFGGDAGWAHGRFIER